MRMSEFILQNLEQIIGEWEVFARTLVPGRKMRSSELRNDLEHMLRAIAADVESPQSNKEQLDKSRGTASAADERSAAGGHGVHRFAQSFTLLETIAEFRALRSSVTRLWLADKTADAQMQQLIRFNEAIDQALTESTAQVVAELDRNRDLFLGTISHDLRNPLQAISISAQALARSPNLAPADKQVADRINDAGKRMQGMVDQLIDFTSARLRQQLALKRQHCNLASVLEQCVQELRASKPSRTIEVRVHGHTEGNWDCPRLGQLLANLVGNALQHGDQQPGAAVEVEVIGDEQEQIDVWVINAGPAIPPEERSGIFEPLRRGRASPEAPGSLGLGLYIARQIAEAHGGKLELASSDDRGTVFHLSLPKGAPVPLAH